MNEIPVGTVCRFLGDFYLTAVILFTAYLSAVMIRRIRAVVLADIYKRVFRVELCLCAALLVSALDVRFGLLTRAVPLPLRFLGRLIRAAVRAGSVLILLLAGHTAAGGLVSDSAGEKYAVVLGMALENGEPNRDLLLRAGTAEDLAKSDPDVTLILTGGNPVSEGRTEAAVMRELLTAGGVPAERIVPEDRSADTVANFRNCARLCSPDEPVVIITSNYHMNRAVRLAKKAGFTRIRRMPAPACAAYYPANLMWEVVMEIHDFSGRIKQTIRGGTEHAE